MYFLRKKEIFLIVVSEFSKSYGKTLAADTVSFVAPSNSITALVGLNGAGKTTILKAIASYHYCDSGSILVNNVDVVENSVLNKEQIGFVCENAQFFRDFTVLEYLKFEASLVLVHNEQKKRILEVIEMFSLQEVLSKKVKTLSKGFTQRLLFAKALLSDPSVLLLDEPTSGLDPRQIVDMRNLIKELGKNKTILISTHIMQEVESLCDNIVIIHKGKLLSAGTEQEICNKTQTKSIEDAFLAITAEKKENYEN